VSTYTFYVLSIALCLDREMPRCSIMGIETGVKPLHHTKCARNDINQFRTIGLIKVYERRKSFWTVFQRFFIWNDREHVRPRGKWFSWWCFEKGGGHVSKEKLVYSHLSNDKDVMMIIGLSHNWRGVFQNPVIPRFTIFDLIMVFDTNRPAAQDAIHS